KYFRYGLGAASDDVSDVERQLAAGTNPRDLKRRLARSVVAEYHDAKAADAAEAHFDRLFVHHETPDDVPEISIRLTDEDAPIAWLLKEAGLASSTTEGQGLVVQGGVSIDGQRVDDPAHRLAVGSTALIKVGKRRFARLKLER
ncbi:MAG: tyrosine--tRNA ligase, partial [Gemmatimonadetes bacterium]|nr:tyrosine--tRNA ligase [Gemmatimonadota bacterium]